MVRLTQSPITTGTVLLPSKTVPAVSIFIIVSVIISVVSTSYASSEDSMRLLSLHPRACAAHNRLYFLPAGHGRITRRRHGQGSMCRAIVDRQLRVSRSHQAIDQTGRKGIAAAHAVHDLQSLVVLRLVDLAVRPSDSAPVVHRCRLHLTQRGGNHFEIRINLRRMIDHLLITVQIQFL